MMLHTLFQANPIEGFFFGSGKSMVVGGVAVIIIVGLGLWMWRMEKRIQRLDESATRQSNSSNESAEA
jgi:FtsZ-interacting cell division protein ZipA